MNYPQEGEVYRSVEYGSLLEVILVEGDTITVSYLPEQVDESMSIWDFNDRYTPV